MVRTVATECNRQNENALFRGRVVSLAMAWCCFFERFNEARGAPRDIGAYTV